MTRVVTVLFHTVFILGCIALALFVSAIGGPVLFILGFFIAAGIDVAVLYFQLKT